MKSEKELPDVTWKEVRDGNGKTIPSSNTFTVREIKNGTSRQTLGSDDEKQIQEIHSED